MVPFLQATHGKVTPALHAGPDATRPFVCRVDNEYEMQHHTNISRMSNLALSHPLVCRVRRINLDKQRGKHCNAEHFDATGRATSRHVQSPRDLRLYLESTDKTMDTGCSVNGVAEDLLKLWRSPHPRASDKHVSEMQVVFFDITETMHIMPTLNVLRRPCLPVTPTSQPSPSQEVPKEREQPLAPSKPRRPPTPTRRERREGRHGETRGGRPRAKA